MSVEIDPVELSFRRPLTQEVSQVLKIKNLNHEPVAFKVKTTAPKQYCVRPNSGRVEPGQEIEVTVLLQAMKAEPPVDAKCRDKFLVQSVAIMPEKEFANVNAIWQHVDDADRSQVREKKIRVIYLPADSGLSGFISTPLKNGQIENHDNDTAPSAYRSPSPEQAYTPDTRKSPTPSGPISKLGDAPSNSKNLSEIKASASNPAATSSSIQSTAQATIEDLKTKLAEAQTTIASYGREGGLRMRKVVAGETSNTAVNEAVHRVQRTEGVPVQIVAALCLLSFLVAYFLF